MNLHDLCGLYRYELVIDPEPHLRDDALGDSTQDRLGRAQLCKNRVIAITGDSIQSTYCISHELAHGLVGFCDEKAVLAEQANILARWVAALLKDIEANAKERLGRRDC